MIQSFPFFNLGHMLSFYKIKCFPKERKLFLTLLLHTIFVLWFNLLLEYNKGGFQNIWSCEILWIGIIATNEKLFSRSLLYKTQKTRNIFRKKRIGSDIKPRMGSRGLHFNFCILLYSLCQILFIWSLLYMTFHIHKLLSGQLGYKVNNIKINI